MFNLLGDWFLRRQWRFKIGFIYLTRSLTHVALTIHLWPITPLGHIGAVWYGGIFFMPEKCENISMLVRRFEATFSGILHSREGKSLPKHFHPYENPTFSWEGNIFHNKKTKIPLSPSKATSRWSLSAAAGCWPSAATPSRVFLEIYQILPGIQFAHQTCLKYHARESYSRK